MRERASESSSAGFPPIGDYGVIGDCGTAALVSRDGAIEWLCLPRFDSPSLFSAILDRDRGGRFRIAPRAAYRATRRYLEQSAVLETRFRTETGVLRLRDCMVAAPGAGEVGALWPEHQILREVCCIEGSVDVDVSCDARFEYGRRPARADARDRLGIFLQHRGDVVVLRGELPLEAREDRIRGRATLRRGDTRYLALTSAHGEPAAIPPLGEHASHLLQETLAYWRGWSDRCDYQGPYRDQVVRSAITLKLMACSSSGAVVAAPTTSLPERIGGVRNWDYRYCWLRDACFTLRALLELGYVEEGNAFFSWLLYVTYQTHADLRVLYDVFGGRPHRERTLAHLRGYRDSHPVRVGNAAAGQLQLDLYGELVASAYEYVRRHGSLGRWSGRLLAKVGDTICARWQQADQGIWEIRTQGRRHVYSIAMCGLALERLCQMAQAGELRLSPRRHASFQRTAGLIRAEIDRHGWSPRLHSFTSTLDGDEVDASLLLLGLYGYVDPRDPRMLATFERLRAELGKNGLLRRYAHGADDGLPAGEGAFGICSFWAVEYLARTDRVEEAEADFERLCGYANDVGLFAEQIDTESGAALGNFPQAFSHVGLVGAALAIAEGRGTRPSARLGGRERIARPGRTAGTQAAEDLRVAERR